MNIPFLPRGQSANRIDEGLTYLKGLFNSPPADKIRFVVFANYRSGSTLLTSLLNSHPKVLCSGEIFLRFVSDQGKLTKMLSPRTYIRGRIDFSRNNHAYGFDVKVDQLSKVTSQRLHGSFTGTLARLHQEGWQIIYLRRRNVFRQTLSNRLAHARKVWHKTDDSALRAVSIDPPHFLKEMMWFERLSKLEAESLQGVPHLKLIYEQDLLDARNHQATADRVFNYLGLSPAPVKTIMRRVTSNDQTEDVVNYDELTEFIRMSGNSHLLES